MELSMDQMLSIIGRLYVTSNSLSSQLESLSQEHENIKQESQLKDKAIIALREEINNMKEKNGEATQSEASWNIGNEKY